MKKLVLLFVILSSFVTFSSGCKKDGCTNVNACNYDPDAEKNDGSCIEKGKVTFWQSSATSYNFTDVTINGSTSTINVDLPSSPSCDESGCANFTLCPGTYSFSAVEQTPGTATWNGSVTITDNGCIRFQLQ